MKKRLFLGLAVIVSMTSGLLANGLNLNGFGARAAAMGGAFVGLADDFTAVFWNPAGLAMLKGTTFGLTGDIIIPKGKYTIGPYTQETTTKKYPVGLLGVFHPLTEKIVVGVGVYTPSGLGAEWDNTGLEPVLASGFGGTITPALGTYIWKSYIGAVTIAPSIAFKISEQIFFGATFNINYGFFKTEQWAELYQLSPSLAVNLGQKSLDVKGWGFGATFGLLVKPVDAVSFGVTVRTPSKLKLSGNAGIENLDMLGPLPVTSGTDLEVTNPLWVAGGVAVKPMSNLTLTLDAQYTNWKKITELVPVFAEAAWAALPDPELVLNWANKIQWRGGAELVLGNFAIRGGYYYDPTPTPDTTLTILVPSYTFNTVSFGVGYRKSGLQLDLAVEYLMGKDRVVAAPSGDNMPGAYEMNILVPMISFSYGW